MTGYMTVKEAAQKWGITERWVQALCASHKIKNVEKLGNIWAIPSNAQCPDLTRKSTEKTKFSKPIQGD